MPTELSQYTVLLSRVQIVGEEVEFPGILERTLFPMFPLVGQ